jgi:hypothetical protein
MERLDVQEKIVSDQEKTRDEKLEVAQEELRPIFRERMSPNSVLGYMMENKRSCFETERGF